MLVERWRRIEALFYEALAKSPAERPGFLDGACLGDASLQREVESLLAHESRAGDFLESAESDPNPPKSSDPIPAGERIGPYTILEPLGSGGMGEVYKAHDPRLDRDVAVKFVSRCMEDDTESLARFEREARAASALNHPNICTVHDVGGGEGRRYTVMELLNGEPLQKRMAGGPLSIPEFASIACQVCAALQAAHEKGIVHRDLKPANIFLTENGQVKVLDFGLATRDSELSAPGIRWDGASRNPMQTTAGTIVGTLAYMSPEQAVGKHAGPRSDLFSLGIVLYEMATGRRPFRGKTPAGILGSILSEAPAKPSSWNARIPSKLDRVILKTLEKEPSKRYAFAAQLSSDLEVFGAAQGPDRVPWLAAAIAGIAIAAAAATVSRWGFLGRAAPAERISRQVTANPPEDPVIQAAISPDGKTVAYEDFAGIHLRRIATGESRLIQPPPDHCFR